MVFYLHHPGYVHDTRDDARYERWRNQVAVDDAR